MKIYLSHLREWSEEATFAVGSAAQDFQGWRSLQFTCSFPHCLKRAAAALAVRFRQEGRGRRDRKECLTT